jgi:hypothetical protein
MNADAAFYKGETHFVCQDYALASNVVDAERSLEPFVVVADGCSSSPSVDVGARILALNVKNLIEYRGYQFKTEREFQAAAILAAENVRHLGLPQSVLDASLGVITTRGPVVNASLYGDGTFIARRKNGLLVVQTVTFGENYPAYVSYELSPERKEKLLSLEDNHKLLHTAFVAAPGHENSGELVEEQKPLQIDSLVVSLEYVAAEYEWIAISTDGISDFAADRRKRKIPAWQIAVDLFAFKGRKGAFVQRRLKNFLEFARECGLEQLDDIGVGALNLS